MVDDTGTLTDTVEGDRASKNTGQQKTDNDKENNGTDKEKTGTGDTKEPKDKTRSVSFNRDVHVKRFGKPRESRGSSAEPSTRKEPFTHLSEQELIEEANKVLEQAGNIRCTSDHPPEKFFSLPHRRKHRDDRDRRNSDDGGAPEKGKALGRSTSDASSRKGKERTSLSTLFRRAQKKSPPAPVIVNTKPKPVVIVKRSKSDVSDLKSNTNLNTPIKPIRKRSGSESEEFLKSLRNKKTQLSPIIESSPRDDYFKKTPPLEKFQKQRIAQKDIKDSKTEEKVLIDTKKVNPIEKPPRYKSPDKFEPKPPIRTKRGKSAEKDKLKETSPTITETPKRKTDIKKSLLVDEIDSFKAKDLNPVDVKERIKESIRKLENNIYVDRDMIHSSQQPPDKPPLTRGHTVDHIVRKLKEDSRSPPPRGHLISPINNGSNVNQPFSYTKPSVSPEPNLFIRTTSPDRVPSPVNRMNDRGVVYAHVVRDPENGSTHIGKQTIHKTYSPQGEKYGHISDEDEGLGYEDRRKNSPKTYDYDYKTNNSKVNRPDGPKIIDSPIRPRFREYKLTSFDDFEPTYSNEYPSMKDPTRDYIETFRGRGDGMDTKKKVVEIDKNDLDFNELSHRRELLESRLNARIFDRIPPGEPVSRYLAETDPIYEANKRMKATEKYVNETAKYMHHTLEKDGFAESTITEDYNKYDSDNHKVKYNTQTRTYEKVPKGEIERREYYIDSLEPRYIDGRKVFPPEPEYEPPSLESIGKPILTPDEYVEKKYRVKKFTSSHDVQKYKGRDLRDNSFGKRKGHYASNPEIAQEREEDYANIRNDAKQIESYHNSLRRVKNKDKHKQEYGIRRHDSGDSQDYYRDNTPRRYDVDNRLVDSGIENDFRKGSSGELHRRKKYESDEEVRNTSMLLQSERRHTEDNYPSEQIYVNGEYVARFKDYDDGYKGSRERSDGSHIDSNRDRYKSPSDEKVSAKPPKAKKLSGLEKVKQLFSRDSSKKSKKEKEVQPTRTRVLKSPDHLARDDSEYKRYTDPEPSDVDTIKKGYDPKEERRYKSSREDLDRHRSSREDIHRSSGEDTVGRHRSSREDLDKHRNLREHLDQHRSSRENLDRHKNSREHLDRHRSSREPRDPYRSSKEDVRHKSSDPSASDTERKYRVPDYDRRYERTLKEGKRHVDRRVARRYNSSERESDHRPSDTESELRKPRSRTAGPLDSPALAERYRERRRLATPSPTPSPPRAPATSAGNWFKSLDRLTRKKKKDTKMEKESILTDSESPRRPWTKPAKPLNSPAKNLRFFGDTDQDSDSNIHQTKPKTLKPPLRKTVSNSSTGVDETDHELTNKSYSLTNLNKDDSKKFYKRNLQNISEINSNSEVESQIDRRLTKPPMSPYDRSRSHSSSKTLKATKNDLQRHRNEERGSSSELRGSKLDLKGRRRTPAHSGESSTEGDSSHQSQRSVVYLHATTVGDIPDPGHLSRNRSRDDVSSVNSSNLQVRNTTKTFSIFAPWTPKLHPDHHDVHYAQKQRKTKPREPFKKASSTRNLTEDRPANLQKNKSYSQTTLTRKPQNSRLTSSNTTLYRKPERTRENSSVQGTTIARKNGRESQSKKSQSSEVLTRDGDRERISRSISMPRDKNKKSGWFNLATSKNKKQENTRVR